MLIFLIYMICWIYIIFAFGLTCHFLEQVEYKKDVKFAVLKGIFWPIGFILEMRDSYMRLK